MMKLPEWVKELPVSISNWLNTVKLNGQPGRFYPYAAGRTKIGNQASLGFSCFALKLYYMLGLWESLDNNLKQNWIKFILSFQRDDINYKGAFVDLPVLNNCDSIKNKIVRFIRREGHPGVSHKRATLIAETKQAIATLSQVGVQSGVPFTDFPHNPAELNEYLRTKLNWTRPWGAGGQSSAIALFVANEAPKFLNDTDVRELKKVMREFFYSIVDKETGGYYIGKRPNYSQLINGAMKVLNAYEWLELEIPYKEKLIDTCLSYLPPSDGCHLVDVIYVLYRCLQETAYRKKEILQYCVKILDFIKKHRKPDGGFSYYIEHNQTNYYGAKIANQHCQSDLHGTYLLCYAITMIIDINMDRNNNFYYIKT